MFHSLQNICLFDLRCPPFFSHLRALSHHSFRTGRVPLSVSNFQRPAHYTYF